MHCKDTILRTQNNWPYSKLIPNSGRYYFPQTQSILMDSDTFNRYFEKDEGKESNVSTALHLTPAEQEIYERIKKNNWRLEQEKIPHYYEGTEKVPHIVAS